MTRGQRRSLIRRLHSGVGWLLGGFLVLVAASGILLQHPAWLGQPDNGPLSLAVDPHDTQHQLRGTHWGVEVSTDGGRNWRELNMLAAPTDVVRVLFVDQGADQALVYALGRDALVASEDGGWVWHDVPLPPPVELAGAALLDVAVAAAGPVTLLTGQGLWERQATGEWLAIGAEDVAGRDWRALVHDLHTGHLGGTVGRRVAEGAAWGLVLLVVTGFVLQQRVRRRSRA